MFCEYLEKVKVRKSFDDNETEVIIARVSSIPRIRNGKLVFPDTITPQGISLERQWYLHDKIVQHIQNPAKRDIYCVMPNQPKRKKSKNLQN